MNFSSFVHVIDKRPVILENPSMNRILIDANKQTNQDSRAKKPNTEGNSA